MMCQIFLGQSISDRFACSEQATMIWVTPLHHSPIPCCVYHAQSCPQGEIVSLTRHDAAGLVTFIQREAHA
jgi:hypothetical protein